MMKKILFLILLLVAFYIPKVEAKQVSVQKPNYEKIILEIESSDTIEAIKEKIFNADNTFIPELQILYYNEVLMEDGRTFGDYEIEGNNVIVLVLKKYKVIFDANGGKFEDKESYFVKWDNDAYDNLVEPKRDGYYFKGYFTEKTGGTKLELILAEAGIDSDRIFYAQWEKAVSNPATSSNYESFILLVVSILSFALLVYKVRKCLVNKL